MPQQNSYAARTAVPHSSSASDARQPNSTQANQRRAWQRPQFQKLHISLDTAESPGSGGDGSGRALP